MRSEQVEVLRALGLTDTECKVYLTVLEIGKSLAGTIADRANIFRKNTYDALQSLLKKGLVTYIISNNKKYWSPVSPERINFILNERINRFNEILPQLLNKFNSKKAKQTVEVFEGIEGMKTFFDDITRSKKDIIMMFATGKAYAQMPHYMVAWDKKINKAKIKVRVLLNSNAPKNPYKNYSYGKIKILPKTFITPTQIFIYGDKSAVAIWAEEPVATLISNKEITDGFRKYFEFLWKISMRVKI